MAFLVPVSYKTVSYKKKRVHKQLSISLQADDDISFRLRNQCLKSVAEPEFYHLRFASEKYMVNSREKGNSLFSRGFILSAKFNAKSVKCYFCEYFVIHTKYFEVYTKCVRESNSSLLCFYLFEWDWSVMTSYSAASILIGLRCSNYPQCIFPKNHY